MQFGVDAASNVVHDQDSGSCLCASNDRCLALDALGAKVGGYISAEADPAARWVSESASDSTQFVRSVGSVTDEIFKSWVCLPRASNRL